MQTVLEEALEAAHKNNDGKIANYIPELAAADAELTNVAVFEPDGTLYTAGSGLEVKQTLQSIAKLVVLIGLLEDVGPQAMIPWVRSEPSGSDFHSIARLDQFGPVPSNPMLNSGAISLCAHIPGNAEQQLAWLENWNKQLFGEHLNINTKVFASERRTGDRNRSLAYLLKSNGLIERDVNEVLDIYFYLCSFEANTPNLAYLAHILANGGLNPKGETIVSKQTVLNVASIMATCGLYNESGTHLVRTGFPSKSGVSGFILATAPRRAGIAVSSPRINRKGTSIRGQIILEHLSKHLNWHFAL